MKKLIKMFKSLPPEMRMMIAMAGLGSPVGIIYALQRWVFPKTSIFVLMICVVGAIAAICLLGWIIAKLFGKGGKKRSNKLAADLAADADAGRSSMDVAAAIKENNQKFFGAINDMKKNVGLSVYDLPWYIVIGDSGCGKTKLINEGGLQFSLGKPEGYQLGTLNYNWWFTEDAVFVDMAGRLINPRDDADRKEWEAFLSTIGKGRKGYPINGVVVCVAADHLLQDPPDRIEQDANTMLERLRDLQSKLGVTFATYLVITKCDKMVGFMQFFDRAERDIRVLNQMVGWSKPGEFQELYDPEEFPDQFEEVYHRLHELRLRRMNDDAEEIDLGLAYGFPEEFRELRDPLHTYVRTLFPKIKNPRAIKNLLYRGLYFTSATREGGLILKHLTDRLGPEAAEQFQPLDLYPSRRPYFIRDFFFRKMFPEHGLVFRNEQQAVRNRKLAKLLKVGSVSLALLLVGTAVMSIWKFADVIDEPRKIATVQLVADQSLPTPPTALQNTRDLEQFAADLDASRWATILSLGVGTHEPVQALREIHAALFERVLLPRAIADISRALRTTTPGAPVDAATREAGQAYLDALEQYVKWVACSGDEASAWQDIATKDSLKTMCAIVHDPKSPINNEDFVFLDHAGYYFDTLALSDDPEDWKSPARFLHRNNEAPQETIQAALNGGVREYLKAFATLDSNNPDPIIGEWMRIWEACDQVQKSYEVMLAYARADIQTSAQMVALQENFRSSYATFSTNLARTGWESEQSISEIRDAILKNREEGWVAYVGKLNTALTECGQDSDGAVAGMIHGLQHTDTMVGLDEFLWSELKKAGLTTKNYPTDAYGDHFMADVNELYKPFDYMIWFDSDAPNNEKLKPTDHARLVDRVLNDISVALDNANLSPDDPPGAPSAWIKRFTDVFERDTDGIAQHDGIRDLAAPWRPRELGSLDQRHETLIWQGSLTAILDTIRVGLSNPGTHGLAMLEPGANEVGNSAYYIEEANFDRRPSSTTTRDPRETKKPKEDRGRRLAPPRRAPPRRGRRGDSPESTRPRAVSKRGEGKIPNWAQPSFLNQRVNEASDLRYYLNTIEPHEFLQSETDEFQLNQLCAQMLRDSTEDYFKSYVKAWSDAYGNLPLDRMKELAGESGSWASLLRSLGRQVSRVGKGYQAVSDEILPALSEILASIPFWGHVKVGHRWESPYTDDRPDYAAVAEWMRSAIGNEWNQSHGVFADKAKAPSIQGIERNEPWTAIAETFAQRWDDFGASLVRVKPFPTAFPEKKPHATKIKWPEFAELRRDTQLEDERITGELQRFEQHAQALLSAEITRVLVDVQERKLPFRTEVGWPLQSEKDVGGKLYKTVEFQGFRDFLREVRNAEAYFKPLEEGLPTTETSEARRTFYLRCHQWYRFLGLPEGDSSSTKPTPLEFGEASFFDPLHRDAPSTDVKIDMTGMGYYNMFELTLGLKVEEDNSAWVAKALKIPTAVDARKQKNWRAKWDWSAKGPMTFKVTDGIPTGSGTETYKSVSTALGTCTPLSICAYLFNGKPLEGDRSTWITAHAVNLPEKLRTAGQPGQASKLEKRGDIQMGLGFRFKLNRSMPEPISELKLSDQSSD